MNSQDPILTRFLADIRKYPILSQSAQAYYANKAKQGDHAAREKVVQSNYRMLVRIAKEFQGDNISINDLIQEGYLGLDMAINNYNSRRKTPFAYFAAWYIRMKIVKFIWWNKTTVRLPDSQRLGINKLIKITARHINDYGMIPSMEELLELSGLSKKTVKNYCSLFNYGTLKSNSPIGELPEESTPVDQEPSPEDYAQQSLLSDAVEKCLQTLQPEHQEFLKDYYGIGRQELTSGEIAKLTGKTSESVRQKRVRLTRYLKKHYTRELATFAEEMEE